MKEVGFYKRLWWLITGRNIVFENEIENQYRDFSSLSDYLPWLDFDDEKRVVLLEDGASLGALFDVKPIVADKLSAQALNDLHEKISSLLSGILPLCDENPWVMQVFVQNDTTLRPLFKRLLAYAAKHAPRGDALTEQYLRIMDDHCNKMVSDEYALHDPMSDSPFKGRMLRLRFCIYRRYEKGTPDGSQLDELESAASVFQSKMKSNGLLVSRMNGERFYEWLVRWFNPNPARFDNTDALLANFPYPDQKPFGFSHSQNIFFNRPKGVEHGWLFDGLEHRVINFTESTSDNISIGAISLERERASGQKFALLDKLPEGSIYTIQITFESRKALDRHLDRIEKAAIGKTDTVPEIKHNVRVARTALDKGHWLFRCAQGIYIRGESSKMSAIENEVVSLIEAERLKVILPHDQCAPMDGYLRLLPFNFSAKFDKSYLHLGVMKYASDVARLLPIYGRSRGDGLNPLFIKFNRGGEPFVFDTYSRDFKQANSHMAIFGGTGAGKSVEINGQCLATSAIHNSRIVVMEVGESIALTGQYLSQFGRKVQFIKFDPANPQPCNPYVEGYKALERIEAQEAKYQQLSEAGRDELIINHETQDIVETLKHLKDKASQEEMQAEQSRDILGEMIYATQTMITQGLKKEEEKMGALDVGLIGELLIHALKRSKSRGIEQMLITHVIESAQILEKEKASSAPEMAEKLRAYTLSLNHYTAGVKGDFLNRPSQPWSDFDFLHIDFGFLKDGRYQDMMNIVCISMLSRILSIAEANKGSKRKMELYLDEAHIFLKSELVSAFFVLMAKVSRKVGLWLRPATQNVRDFEGVEAVKSLSMMETWLCLTLSKDEINVVQRFKELSPEIVSMLKDTRTYQKVYSEGVLLNSRHTGLFRNIPPKISLALSMTEQDERAERLELAEARGISELEAIGEIAKTLKAPKLGGDDDDHIWY